MIESFVIEHYSRIPGNTRVYVCAHVDSAWPPVKIGMILRDSAETYVEYSDQYERSYRCVQSTGQWSALNEDSNQYEDIKIPPASWQFLYWDVVEAVRELLIIGLPPLMQLKVCS